ncbi:uncharacterized, partial [Tachysurus ichikawai]
WLSKPHHTSFLLHSKEPRGLLTHHTENERLSIGIHCFMLHEDAEVFGFLWNLWLWFQRYLVPP